MFLACVRTAVSQSARLASMRSGYVAGGRLAVHARSFSGVGKWTRSLCLAAYTPHHTITSLQCHRSLHTPGKYSVTCWGYDMTETTPTTTGLPVWLKSPPTPPIPPTPLTVISSQYWSEVYQRRPLITVLSSTVCI